MVCGASGIGKSSFVDLFMKKFEFQETIELDQTNNETFE
jgi:hypothetical protein